MTHNLSDEVLAQEITVRLPLRALINLGARDTLNAARIVALKQERPQIGDKGLYGINVGIARADAQGGDHILEVLEGDQRNVTWQKAMEWAASIGGTLPTRKEQALLFANVPELFEKSAYWSCEQYAGAEGYAWCQGFGNGHQDNCHECVELRARAVRRLNLE